MAPSKLRKAIGAVKDQTSISLAKVGGSTCLADLDVAIVKATRHEEYPAEERHIREILTLTVYSRAYVGACVSTISRRLNKTKNWVVAIKALMLIHRLLNDGNPAYEQEIFFATRRGTRLLNLYDFRDTSRSDSWDYSAFVRTYALYLDEQLEFRMQGRRGKSSAFAYEEEDEEVGPGASTVKTTTPLREMKNDRIFSRLQHMLQLLERFLACRPTGAAKTNRVVIVALYPIVKESFQLYYDITEIMGVLLDRFMELDIPDSLKVHEIFCRVAKQYDELDDFYVWSKSVGIARSSEYPQVDKISNKKLDVMDEFIREKSLMEQNMYIEHEDEPEEEAKQPESEPEPEEDMNATKALPPPEEFVEESKKKEEMVEKVKKQDIGDLLNLGEDAPTTEQYADKLALALFEGGSSENTTGPANGASPWKAYKYTGDWEASLVQSASHLSNQKPTLPGGFDTLMLDGMYQQGTTAAAAASSGYIATGSASSVALGSTGRPAVLALPAPESAQNLATSSGSGDPFAASLAVPPPAYVQMSEMEKKQRLLMEEQMMWQQYTSTGMQGHVGLAKVQQTPVYPYDMGGYTQSY